MMKKRNILFLTLLMATLVTGLTTSSASAQSSNDIYRQNELPTPAPVEEGQSLKDILVPDPNKPENPKQMTGEDYANFYFKKCVASEQNYLSEENHTALCACTAANMTKFMTPEQMQLIYADSKNGDKARQFMMVNAYGPCMPAVTRDATYGRCLIENKLREIVSGKGKVCDCTADALEYYVNINTANIFYHAFKEAPLTIDPLERFIDGDTYMSVMRGNLDRCLYNLTYGDKQVQ
ncbi:MAG: hypothetical protein KDI13_09590 [Alphaproteobacteria bacterium]|nr:hypothetical protein [Alphaproteobacteria bacterium]